MAVTWAKSENRMKNGKKEMNNHYQTYKDLQTISVYYRNVLEVVLGVVKT